MIQSDNNPTADRSDVAAGSDARAEFDADAKTPADQKSERERREYLSGARDFLAYLDSISDNKDKSQQQLLDRGRVIVDTIERSGGPIRR